MPNTACPCCGHARARAAGLGLAKAQEGIAKPVLVDTTPVILRRYHAFFRSVWEVPVGMMGAGMIEACLVMATATVVVVALLGAASVGFAALALGVLTFPVWSYAVLVLVGIVLNGTTYGRQDRARLRRELEAWERDRQAPA